MFKKNPLDDKIDSEMDRLLTELKLKYPETKEYAATSDQLIKLYELRHKSRISADQLAAIAANLLGMLLVIKAENVGIITTKAFSLVKKIF